MERYSVVADGEHPTVKVMGSTRAELFEHAGLAVFALSYDLSAVKPTYSRPVVAPGDTMDELLVNWIDELLAWSRSEALVWSYFVVDRLEVGGVQGSASGLPRTEVPALSRLVTRAELTGTGIVEIPNGWWTELRLYSEPRLRSL